VDAGGETRNEGGQVLILSSRDAWMDSFVPRLRFGDAALIEERLEWLVLLRRCVTVIELSRSWG
jgi:hypothetical protein